MRALLVVAIAMAGCATPERSVESLTQTGDIVSGALAGRLTSALQAKLAAEGPVAAIGFCNLEALPLTAEVARAHPEVKGVRRIGVRTRNPANAGDALDRQVLARLAEGWKSGVTAPAVVSDGSGGARYYRPLPTAGTCLACHGPAESMAAPVAEVLRRLYPRDEATGFRAGDLRGAIVVEF
ncbi:MAG: DUF3365 domain-containing protein [Opitutia bacterium]